MKIWFDFEGQWSRSKVTVILWECFVSIIFQHVSEWIWMDSAYITNKLQWSSWSGFENQGQGVIHKICPCTYCISPMCIPVIIYYYFLLYIFYLVYLYAQLEVYVMLGNLWNKICYKLIDSFSLISVLNTWTLW